MKQNVQKDLRFFLHPTSELDVVTPGFPPFNAFVLWLQHQDNIDEVVQALFNVLETDGFAQQYAAICALRQLAPYVTHAWGDGYEEDLRYEICYNGKIVTIEPNIKE